MLRERAGGTAVEGGTLYTTKCSPKRMSFPKPTCLPSSRFRLLPASAIWRQNANICQLPCGENATCGPRAPASEGPPDPPSPIIPIPASGVRTSPHGQPRADSPRGCRGYWRRGITSVAGLCITRRASAQSLPNTGGAHLSRHMWHRREIMRFGGIQVGGEVRGRDLTCQRKEFWSLVAFLPPVPRSENPLHDFF